MPIVRRRPDSPKPADDARDSRDSHESPRVSMPMPRAREPMPTTEFSPEELAEQLERLRTLDRTSEVPPPAPSPAGPKRTRSGERPIVRPAIPTPADLARDHAPVEEASANDDPVLEIVDQQDVDEVAADTLAHAHPYVPSASPPAKLGATSGPMEIAPVTPAKHAVRPTPWPRAQRPMLPVGAQLRPRRSSRVLGLLVLLAVVLTIAFVVHRFL